MAMKTRSHERSTTVMPSGIFCSLSASDIQFASGQMDDGTPYDSYQCLIYDEAEGTIRFVTANKLYGTHPSPIPRLNADKVQKPNEGDECTIRSYELNVIGSDSLKVGVFATLTNGDTSLTVRTPEKAKRTIGSKGVCTLFNRLKADVSASHSITDADFTKVKDFAAKLVACAKTLTTKVDIEKLHKHSWNVNKIVNDANYKADFSEI